MSSNESKTANRNSVVIGAIGLSITSWPIAFNFGVYNTILYPHLFSILAASIAIVLVQVFLGVREFKSRYLQYGFWIVLLLPTTWLLFEIISHGTDSSLLQGVRFLLALAAGFISLPYITYYITIKMVPGVEGARTRRERYALVGVFTVIVVIGYISGLFHQYLLSCVDFEIAGSMIPHDCWDGR